VIDDDALRVWVGPRLAGHLWRDDQDRLGFQYDEQWLGNGFRLSARLPLTDQPYTPQDRGAHFFFRNLLPEAGARQRLVTSHRLTDSDFVLLREFGGDCAGALSILPCEADLQLQGEYQLLDEEALHGLVLRRGTTVHGDTVGPRPRLSLAGAQDKCPILYTDSGYSLPRGSAASTHILKFTVPDFRHVPLYEAFLAELAANAGLPVAETTLGRVRDETFLTVTRYDRYWRGDEVHRLHQEDFLQALGHEFRDKYQAQGGPGLADCMQVVRSYSEEPAKDLLHLLRWQVFNVLAGNSDAHAKNLSLVQVAPDEDRWRLAPFYDLVCTRAIERVDASLAMAVGEQYTPQLITEEDWRRLAQQCGLAPKLVLGEVSRMARELPGLFRSSLAQFESRIGDQPALQRVFHVIEKQCGRVGW
jgi:serine/threonine-protein kinase HipA